MRATVLICDDEEAITWALRKAFEQRDYTVAVSGTAEDALAKARQLQPAVVFMDVRLPGMDGLTALAELKQIAPHAAVVVMTAHGNLAIAVKAVSGGAFDYLSKPFDLSQALDILEQATNTLAPPPTTDGLSTTNGDELLGHSPSMQHVFKRIAMVAPTNTCVLITGESGTGKELVARAIHTNSNRAKQPFLPVHIAALNPNLVESELFGHVRGAFTGADKPRVGLLALADGGTVFLDELGDISLPVQAKLLRVLERQEVYPVGGVEPVKVNVRVISATNANLAGAVAKQSFRQDLFYRLNVYPIHLPPLRERRDDIPQLVEAFLAANQTPGVKLSPEALTALQQRDWPGNVRELKNAIEHAVVMARQGMILPSHLPAGSVVVPKPASTDQQLVQAVRAWVEEKIATATGEPLELQTQLLGLVEPPLLQEVLERLDGNRLVAARWLGLARATVRKLIAKYQLETPVRPEDEPDESSGESRC